MHRRARAAAVLLVLASCARDDAKPSDRPEPKAEQARASSEIYRTDRVLELRLSLDPAAMAALAREPRKYVRGRFEHAGVRYADVGVRFKGNRTLRKWSDKPSFKVSFDKHDKNQRFFGQRELILNAMVEDSTLLRETLGMHVLRALSVPAPRTGFAELFVNDERYGLYTLVEAIDRELLAQHFLDPSGPVYEGEYGCDVLPDDVLRMELEQGDDPERKHIRELARRAGGPISELLDPEEGLLDRERFFAFLAGSALIADFDGYRHAHNYRLYRDPGTGRFSLLPWGLDRVLKKRMDIYESYGVLARSCFADAGCRFDYVKAVHRAADRFEKLGLEAELDRLQVVIAAAAKRDVRRSVSSKKRAQELDKTRTFLRERASEARAQASCWDGTRELDRDGDGHGCMDCNDGDAAIHPGAVEACDGADNDCSGLVDDAPSCPHPTLEVSGASFSLCDLSMTYEQAVSFCEARGEQLARIDDKQQAKALQDAAEELRETDWWIGLNDREHEGKLAWQDGSAVSFTYFARDEPDHHACGQHCGALKDDAGGRFRDLHCESPRPFICRRIQP